MNIGLIAGGGQFPILFSDRAAERGYKVYAVGIRSETDPVLQERVRDMQWLHIGQVSKLIKYFKAHQISKAVMMGSINKPNVFKDIRPDFSALKFIAKHVVTHDDNVLRSFSDLLLKEGIEIISSTFLLPELISPRGIWTRRKPDKAEKKDIIQGWKIAREIGRLDIGQCLVISNGSVLAVEAIDGTDATILRGGQLSGENNCTVVKLCKPHQDLRFDLPSSGVQTIETMHEAGAGVLALEAEKSLSFDRERMILLADRYGISIAGFTDEDIE